MKGNSCRIGFGVFLADFSPAKEDSSAIVLPNPKLLTCKFADCSQLWSNSMAQTVFPEAIDYRFKSTLRVWNDCALRQGDFCGRSKKKRSMSAMQNGPFPASRNLS